MSLNSYRHEPYGDVQQSSADVPVHAETRISGTRRRLPATVSVTTHVTEAHSRRRSAPATSLTIRFNVFTEVHMISPTVLESWGSQGLGIGDVVVTQGDRGEDVGTVERVVLLPLRNASSQDAPRILRRATEADLARYHWARHRESELLPIAQQCVATAGLEDQMSIVALEFQADFQKLTVVFQPLHRQVADVSAANMFQGNGRRRQRLHNRLPHDFESDMAAALNTEVASPSTVTLINHAPRIDFRGLQRILFRRFNCRIWLIDIAELPT